MRLSLPGLPLLAATLLAAACAATSEPEPGPRATVSAACGEGAAPRPDAGRSPTGRTYWVYVTSESSDEVYLCRFDGEDVVVEQRIEVGYQPTEIEGPHGLTVDPEGDHWYLTMAHGKPFGLLYKYRTGTNELVGQTELGLFPATMQISPSTGLLYCVNFDLHGDMSPSSVSVVDPEAMVEVARTTTGPMPHGSRVSPDGLFHYSCAMMTGQLFELDARTFEVVRTLDLDPPAPAMEGHEGHAGHAAAGPHGASKPTWVYPHPDGERVYVALNGQKEIVEVDLASWSVSRRFATPKGPYNVEVSPDGRLFAATYKSSASIGVWDVESGRELARLPSTRPVPHGVVISDDSRYAFVSNEGIGSQRGTLDVIDLATLERVASVELGLQAGGIAFWRASPPPSS